MKVSKMDFQGKTRKKKTPASKRKDLYVRETASLSWVAIAIAVPTDRLGRILNQSRTDRGGKDPEGE